MTTHPNRSRRAQQAQPIEPPSTHGGRREGAGRKAIDGATGLIRRYVSLDPESLAALVALGDGNLSLGIRRAAAKIFENNS